MKIINTLILFASLGLLVMWVDQFIYKGVDLKDSYFFLMFSVSGFLYYTYRRGLQKINEDSEKKDSKNEKKKK
jgi:hypothetical protein